MFMFIVGLMLGGALGLCIMAMCCMSKKIDAEIDDFISNKEEVGKKAVLEFIHKYNQDTKSWSSEGLSKVALSQIRITFSEMYDDSIYLEGFDEEE